MTTLAVLRPTPGSASSSSRVEGTSPPYFSTSARAAPTILLAFMRKKPVDLIKFSTSGSAAFANACGVGYAANRNGVVKLTRTSVVCAESMTAIKRVKGESYSSAVTACG